MKRILIVPALVLAFAAAAQERPAVSTEPAASPRAAPEVGTTVFGERDSPLGLYIMPWQESAAEAGQNRPARLLNEALQPHDADEFHRQFLYYHALSEHLEKTGRATP